MSGLTLQRGTRRWKTLAMLQRGPRTNFEIAEALVDHSGAVARDMCKLRDAGLTVNTAPGKGRIAIYDLTEAGRAAIAKATGEAAA
jgi:predicted ArsR family transcriptional regulator